MRMAPTTLQQFLEVVRQFQFGNFRAYTALQVAAAVGMCEGEEHQGAVVQWLEELLVEHIYGCLPVVVGIHFVGHYAKHFAMRYGNDLALAERLAAAMGFTSPAGASSSLHDQVGRLFWALCILHMASTGHAAQAAKLLLLGNKLPLNDASGLAKAVQLALAREGGSQAARALAVAFPARCVHGQLPLGIPRLTPAAHKQLHDGALALCRGSQQHAAGCLAAIAATSPRDDCAERTLWDLMAAHAGLPFHLGTVVAGRLAPADVVRLLHLVEPMAQSAKSSVARRTCLLALANADSLHAVGPALTGCMRPSTSDQVHELLQLVVTSFGQQPLMKLLRAVRQAQAGGAPIDGRVVGAALESGHLSTSAWARLRSYCCSLYAAAAPAPTAAAAGAGRGSGDAGHEQPGPQPASPDATGDLLPFLVVAAVAHGLRGSSERRRRPPGEGEGDGTCRALAQEVVAIAQMAPSGTSSSNSRQTLVVMAAVLLTRLGAFGTLTQLIRDQPWAVAPSAGKVWSALRRARPTALHGSAADEAASRGRFYSAVGACVDGMVRGTAGLQTLSITRGDWVAQVSTCRQPALHLLPALGCALRCSQCRTKHCTGSFLAERETH